MKIKYKYLKIMIFDVIWRNIILHYKDKNEKCKLCKYITIINNIYKKLSMV